MNRRVYQTSMVLSLMLLAVRPANSQPWWNPTDSDAKSNTAGGAGALFHNTTGSGNTAFGCDALLDNTTGYYNTAFGCGALLDNTTGTANTASGFQALFKNTEGYYKDRKSTRLNSSHIQKSRMPSSA